MITDRPLTLSNSERAELWRAACARRDNTPSRLHQATPNRAASFAALLLARGAVLLRFCGALLAVSAFLGLVFLSFWSIATVDPVRGPEQCPLRLSYPAILERRCLEGVRGIRVEQERRP